jgi:TfoX/Sxy family transcriptional regulator of competence genes
MTRLYLEDDAGDVREVLEDAILGWEGVSVRRMFGCPSYLADGVLFAIVINRGVVLTLLDPAARAELAETASVEPFRAGHKLIHRWARVNIDKVDEVEAILPFVRQSYRAAMAEPT